MKGIKAALLRVAGASKSKTWWSFFLMVAAVGAQDEVTKAIFASAIAIIYWMPEKTLRMTINNVTVQSKDAR